MTAGLGAPDPRCRNEHFFGEPASEQFDDIQHFDFIVRWNLPLWRKLGVWTKATIIDLFDCDELREYQLTGRAEEIDGTFTFTLPVTAASTTRRRRSAPASTGSRSRPSITGRGSASSPAGYAGDGQRVEHVRTDSPDDGTFPQAHSGRAELLRLTRGP